MHAARENFVCPFVPAACKRHLLADDPFFDVDASERNRPDRGRTLCDWLGARERAATREKSCVKSILLRARRSTSCCGRPRSSISDIVPTPTQAHRVYDARQVDAGVDADLRSAEADGRGSKGKRQSGRHVAQLSTKAGRVEYRSWVESARVSARQRRSVAKIHSSIELFEEGGAQIVWRIMEKVQLSKNGQRLTSEVKRRWAEVRKERESVLEAF